MNATTAEPTAPATKPRYYAPTVRTDVDVSLSEFNDDEIIEYCRQKNITIGVAPSQVDYGSGICLEPSELARIETLTICGQRQEARDFLCRIVGDQIGRAL